MCLNTLTNVLVNFVIKLKTIKKSHLVNCTCVLYFAGNASLKVLYMYSVEYWLLPYCAWENGKCPYILWTESTKTKNTDVSFIKFFCALEGSTHYQNIFLFLLCVIYTIISPYLTSFNSFNSFPHFLLHYFIFFYFQS